MFIARLITGASLMLLTLSPVAAQEPPFTPVTVFAEWDPLPLEVGVIVYELSFDGVKITNLSPGDCFPTVCRFPITVTTGGDHTITLTATNWWGVGPVSSITFNAATPRIKGLRWSFAG